MNKIQGKNVFSAIDNENVLQAVIIADNFTKNLSPFCDFMNTSLLPLANRPLLDYTLECLYSSGVQETILFCSSFVEQVKSFVESRSEKWPGFNINVVVSEGCHTLGDVMRDLDTKALIRSDFILLPGNFVGNLELLPALERHKRIQRADKGAVMTLVLKECGKRCKTMEDDFVIATDSKTNRVLLFSKTLKNPGKIEFLMDTLLDNPEIDLRCDLLDTQVSVCSVAVPPLFSDNFDFQTMDDFVRGLLVNEEILTSSVYCYTLPNGQYAAPVSTWAHYQDVTHDVINRWVYPMVPDMILEEPYNFRRNNIYTQGKINLSQICKLEEDVVIGNGSSIGQNSTISRSVIGRNCQIGNNVVVNGAFIMDNAVIINDCCVTHSVLGPGVTLHQGAKVTDGSVLGIGVTIDADKHIAALKLQAYPPDGASPDGKICEKAYLYDSTPAEDSDSDSDVNEVVTGLRISRDYIEDHWIESSESDGETTRSLSPMPEDTNLFYNEVVDSLVRGYEDKLPCDNLVLEINSSRYAYNVSMSEVNFHVVQALLTLPAPDGHSWQQLAARLKYFMPIFTNYIRTETAQKDCLFAIEDVAGTHSDVFNIMVKIIHWLYDQDILSEDIILHWYNNPNSDSDLNTAKRVRHQVTPFINWLKEAEEQSEDDDDD